MSDMPPPIPPKPRTLQVRPATALPPRRAAPPARPHPPHLEYSERVSFSRRSSSTSTSSTTSSFLSSTTTGFSGYLGSTAGFTSRARAALSSAGSLAASAASQVASSASGSGEKKQTWEEWARDWRDGRKAAIKGVETIHVFPGWAVKRPHKAKKHDGDNAFDMHVSVGGFCTFVRDASSASRTQRAIMRIAKRFAALPALPVPSLVQAVAGAERHVGTTLSEEPEGMEKLSLEGQNMSSKPQEQDPASGMKRTTTDSVFLDPEQLSLAHHFLDLRLRPFWSSVLAYRRVAISMYPIPLKRGVKPKPDPALFEQEPLVRTTFTTNKEGHFSHNVVIPWERICTHPQSLQMAFADDPANDRTDWGIVVRAQLLSEDGPDKLRPATGAPEFAADATSRGTEPVPRRIQGATSFFSSAEEPDRNDGDGEEEMGLMGLGKTSVESYSVLDVSRPGGIRVISDLDDTVKHTDILSGPREVFRNVFCRRPQDICVPGMDHLYFDLYKAGLSGLHFVSNSPFELFPVVSEFLRSHEFPSFYSLKLKFYGGRSIVSSLFEPAGQRKRPNVLEVMDEFYDSKFILIGDSGEQDLELYSAIAHERPHQVAAIFIRDVTSSRVDELRRTTTMPITDDVMRESPSSSRRGSAAPSISSGRSSPTGGRDSTSEDLAQTMEDLKQLSAAEQKIMRRAAEWETRVARAYSEIPSTVKLVFFEDVDEIEGLAKELVKSGGKPVSATQAEHEAPEEALISL